MIRLIAIIVLCFVSITSSANETKHRQLDMYGFRVMISNDIVKNRAIYLRVIKQADKELKAITEVIPEFSLNLLRDTTIWFENKMPKPFTNRMFFNGSKRLSKVHNIEYTYGGVISASPRSYLGNVPMHPWSLLHELTHAYHQFNTKHNYRPILKAHENAKKIGLHHFGSRYPLKNHKEYFSELTESYFGRNINYPANRKELAVHDPMGYCAIVKAWGLLGKQPKTDTIQCN